MSKSKIKTVDFVLQCLGCLYLLLLLHLLLLLLLLAADNCEISQELAVSSFILQIQVLNRSW